MLHLLSLLFPACSPSSDSPAPLPESQLVTLGIPDDADRDNYTPSDGDCDDNNPSVHPFALETCNGIDDNCANGVDDSFPDIDQDGTADCMDEESCDGRDNDGNGLIDDGFSDTDGNGTPDCRDQEVCDGLDNNGNGKIDEGFDADLDGFTRCGGDCDDSVASTHPGAVDGEDEVDNNCDALIDEGVWREGDLVITEVFNNPSDVQDPDGEWFEVYNASGETRILNGMWIRSGEDAWQVSASEWVRLKAGEYLVIGANAEMEENGGVPVELQWKGLSLGNEVDSLELWAGTLMVETVKWDDGVTMPDPSGLSLSLDPWFRNALDNNLATVWCSATPSPGLANPFCDTYDHDQDHATPAQGDCDDLNPSVFPGASEQWYDGVDQNCDGWDDYDQDQDGFRSADWGGPDCGDNNPAISPVGIEVCDASYLDENCDSVADDQDPTVTGKMTFYEDQDGDGYGDLSVLACHPRANQVLESGDCNDQDSAVSPIAPEICGNGQDDNCNDIPDQCSPAPMLGTGVYWYENASYGGDLVTAQVNALKSAGASSYTESRSWPSDLSSYRVFFWVIPNAALSSSQISQISEFMEKGGILVTISEAYGLYTRAPGYFNSAFAQLGIGSTYMSVSVDVTCKPWAATLQNSIPGLTDGVSSLTYAYANGINVGSNAQELFRGSSYPLVVREDHALLIADGNPFYQGCTIYGDNSTFTANIFRWSCDYDGDGVQNTDCGGADADDNDILVGALW